MKKILWACFLGSLTFCLAQHQDSKMNKQEVSLIVLGTVQDGGSPHIGCKKDCCSVLFDSPDLSRKVVSLGLVDTSSEVTFLFEATPDIASQLKFLQAYSKSDKETPNGIFLTHAHIGHYTGLQFLGREAMNSDNVPVYVMPTMRQFIENNGPWSQLVALENIVLQSLMHGQKMRLTKDITVIPFKVPHRDEFSETVGYQIIGPKKSALFIPDIDKWHKWETAIVDKIKKVDYAFLDATFFDGAEINNRDISEIPHPFVIESMALFKDLTQMEKEKIHFIHFNHTNPLLDNESAQMKILQENGFGVARFGQVFKL